MNPIALLFTILITYCSPRPVRLLSEMGGGRKARGLTGGGTLEDKPFQAACNKVPFRS